MKTYLGRNRKLKRFVVFASLILTGLILAGVYWSNSQYKDYSLEILTIELPDTMKVQDITDQDKIDQILLRAMGGQENSLLTIRTENDLRKGANISQKTVVQYVESNLLKRYPQLYPEFSVISQTQPTIDNRDSIDIIFKYKNNNQVILQRFIAIQRNDDQAVYIAFQAKETEFIRFNERYMERIINSISVK